MWRIYWLVFLPTCVFGATLSTLYNTLDPLSVSEHVAFYELYPNTPEGKKSLDCAWKLLGGITSDLQGLITLPQLDIQSIISLITRQASDTPITLTQTQLQLVEDIGQALGNRSLKGRHVWTQEEVLQLPPEEIDLARGLLLFQFDDIENPRDAIRQYEATLDLMALQILARLSPKATHEEMIAAINYFIFYEMRFRFPPHSLHARDIDLYTFLPSVLDNRQGVCLGVSILYLCIAQRLNLPLEIITPPGHIYVRYRNGVKTINIETTARGVNPPSETYLGVNTRKLQQRNMKEVIGLAFMNQASVFWSKEDYPTTVQLYEKATLFLPSDPLLKMLKGLNYLFIGKKNEGSKLLKSLKNAQFEEAVSPETIPDDYLSGKIDNDGLKAIFLPVDETRESILKKQEELKGILKKHPQFRAGLLHLATTWLQLGRGSEAKEILERYHRLDPHNVIVEYYLTVLSMERLDYNRAWFHLNQTEMLVHDRSHRPKLLQGVRGHLRRLCPEPL